MFNLLILIAPNLKDRIVMSLYEAVQNNNHHTRFLNCILDVYTTTGTAIIHVFSMQAKMQHRHDGETKIDHLPLQQFFKVVAKAHESSFKQWWNSVKCGRGACW